jgi:hypothetical protein
MNYYDIVCSLLLTYECDLFIPPCYNRYELIMDCDLLTEEDYAYLEFLLKFAMSHDVVQ